MNARPASVCFVSWRAWPAIDPSAGGPVGGSESRAWLLAQGLSRTGRFDVRFVVRHSRPIRDTQRDGVTIVPVLDRLSPIREHVSDHVEVTGGFPPLRLRRWTWPLLWQVPLLAVCRPFKPGTTDPREPHPFLLSLNADAYCAFGASAAALQVLSTAQALGRPSLLFLGSNADLPLPTAESAEKTPYGEPVELCRRAVAEATIIVAQTEHQRHLLEEHFARNAVVIENPIDLARWEPSRGTAQAFGQSVPERFALWVGRADDFHKRPRLCLDLARLCPDVPFVMVLNPRVAAVEEEVRRSAPANVTIIERVPPDEMPPLMRRASVFISTSAAAYEGFPNVFLQAAACRVPILSLETGSDFIRRAGCGVVTDGRLDDLAEHLKRLWIDNEHAHRLGEMGHAYVAAHHSLEVKSAELTAVLEEALKA